MIPFVVFDVLFFQIAVERVLFAIIPFVDFVGWILREDGRHWCEQTYAKNRHC